jgi:hypothetical protein
MRHKFKILYPQDHPDEAKRGKRYKPPKDHLVVMNGGGVFFLVDRCDFYTTITKLSDTLPKYDVEWTQ